MGLGICVHDVNVMNTVSTIMPDVTYQYFTLLLRGLWFWHVGCDCYGFGTGRLFLWPLHSATYEYEGVVAHVRGCESFYGRVRDTVTDIVVERRDKAVCLQSREWQTEKLSLQSSSNEGGLGALGYISGRGHVAILSHPVPPHLL